MVMITLMLATLVIGFFAYAHARLCYENRGYDLETCNESSGSAPRRA